LKKEYVVTQISASPDGSPYVFVSLRDPEDVGGPQDTSYQSVSTFTSMEDMFRNLNRVLSKQLTSGFSTVIRLGLDEYEKLGVKVGDRVSLDIQKMQVGIP